MTAQTSAGAEDIEPTDPGARAHEGGDLEHTQLSSRRAAAAEEVDESTVMSVRRTAEVDDVDDHTEIAVRRKAAADDVDDHTEIASRRKDADDHTAISSRRGGEVDDRTEVAARRKNQVDDATSIGTRRRRSAPAEPAAIPTLELSARRTTRITENTGPLVRMAAAPDQAILKAPYKPRQQQVAPEVVHIAPNAPTRPPKPLEESIQLISRQRKAAHRRLTMMAAAGTGTMLLSAGGIVALWMLG